MKRPGPLARPPVDVQTIVHPDRPERRLPSYTRTRSIPQIRWIEWGTEPIDVPDVEEHRDPQAEWQGDDVLDIGDDLAGATRLEPGVVDRRDTPELEGADRVRTPQVEALPDRQILPPPPLAVSGLEPSPQDVAEPDRLEIRLEEGCLVELRVAPEPGEVKADRGLPALGRRCDQVAAVLSSANG